MQPLPVLSLHLCCTNSHTVGTAKSVRIPGSHCNRVNMVVKICTIHVTGQCVWAVAHNIFTNKRQLIVYLQTTDFFFCINTLTDIYAKCITYSCQENRAHLY